MIIPGQGADDAISTQKEKEDKTEVLIPLNILSNTDRSLIDTLNTSIRAYANQHRETLQSLKQSRYLFEKSITDHLIKDLNKQTIKAAPQIYREDFEKLPHVESVKWDEETKTLAIITEAFKTTELIDNSNFETPVPSYTILYKFEKTTNLIDKESLEIVLKIGKSLSDLEAKQNISCSIYLTDYNITNLILRYSSFFNYYQNETPPITSMNPYVSSIISAQTNERYGQSSDICYGELNAEQQILLQNGDLYMHFQRILNTLYVPDQDGVGGYSAWCRTRFVLLSYQKIQELEKRAKDTHDIHFPFLTKSKISSHEEEVLYYNHFARTEESFVKVKAPIIEAMKTAIHTNLETTNISTDNATTDFNKVYIQKIISVESTNTENLDRDIKKLTVAVKTLNTINDDENNQEGIITEFELTPDDYTHVTISGKRLTTLQFNNLTK